MPGVPYVSFDDPASGSGADAWTKAIAHREGDRVVLDALRAWVPPFNPSGIIAESAALSNAYGLHVTTGDRYAPGFVLEGFRTHGVTYKTESIYRRYAIVDEAMQREAAARLDAWRTGSVRAQSVRTDTRAHTSILRTDSRQKE